MPIVADVVGHFLVLHGRVWVTLPADLDPEAAYAYAGAERDGWSVVEPRAPDEFLSWGVHEGLVAWDETSTFLSPKGKESMTRTLEAAVMTLDARVLTADANLRGNLLPSSAQAAVRSILNREQGLHYVVEPDDDLEALLAGSAVGADQTVVVLSWRRPMSPRRWARLRPGMEKIDQYLAYEEVNASWADATRDLLTGDQDG